jgi:subtilisin family serine protease
MHGQIRVVALFAAITLAGCSTDVVAPEKAVAVSKSASAVAGQAGNYIVLMKGTAIASGFAESVSKLGGTVTYANGNAGFATVSGLTDAAASQVGAITGIAEIDADQVATLDTPTASAEADASALGNPSINSIANPASSARNSWQWDMRAIGAPAAWAAGKLGSPTVTVAILDTGIDYDNPDLNGQVDLSRSTSFMDTYVLTSTETVVRPSDNQVSTTFFPTRNKISDYNGHGTNVAATVSSNAVVFAGVGSKTKLIGVKVLGSNGSGSFGQILSGILWAADHGADVANMSLGGAFSKAGNGQLVAAINKVFNYAKQQGMLIVVSAGNSAADLQHNGNTYSSFCDAAHVVCVSSVGATTWNGNPDVPAFYTNYGRNSISVAAPGGNAALDANGNIKASIGWPWALPKADIASWVWSFCSKTRLAGFTTANKPVLTACAAGNRLSGFIGTSQASPHVAGLAALVIADVGAKQPQKIKHILEASGDPIDPALGRGRINVKNALGL